MSFTNGLSKSPENIQEVEVRNSFFTLNEKGKDSLPETRGITEVSTT